MRQWPASNVSRIRVDQLGMAVTDTARGKSLISKAPIPCCHRAPVGESPLTSPPLHRPILQIKKLRFRAVLGPQSSASPSASRLQPQPVSSSPLLHQLSEQPPTFSECLLYAERPVCRPQIRPPNSPLEVSKLRQEAAKWLGNGQGFEEGMRPTTEG